MLTLRKEYAGDNSNIIFSLKPLSGRSLVVLLGAPLGIGHGPIEHCNRKPLRQHLQACDVPSKFIELFQRRKKKPGIVVQRLRGNLIDQIGAEIWSSLVSKYIDQI